MTAESLEVNRKKNSIDWTLQITVIQTREVPVSLRVSSMVQQSLDSTFRLWDLSRQNATLDYQFD